MPSTPEEEREEADPESSSARLLPTAADGSAHSIWGRTGDGGLADEQVLDGSGLPDIRGHLLGRQGAWGLRLEPAALRFVHLRPAGGKPAAGVKAEDEAVAYSFDDIAGVGFISDGDTRNQYLCVYRYLRKPSGDPSKRSPRQRQLVLFRITRPGSPAGAALVRQMCADAVALSVRRDFATARERPLLVLLNPHSGQGRAERLFREKAAPVLQEAGLACSLVRTEFAGHATQLLRDCPNLGAYAGLVIVSGDGLLYEALNGLAARPDWRRALRQLPFGVLPAGGGNAMAAALAHANGDCLTRDLVATAAFNLAKSRPRPVDLALVEVASGARHLACLSVNYGLLAQVDLDSERYRFMGLARFAFAFGLSLMSPRLRTYRARLSYLPAPPDGGMTPPSAGSLPDDCDDADLGSVKRHLPASLADPLPADAGWVTLEADFLFVLVSLQSHLATDNFYVPPCRPDDGRLYVTWVQTGITKAALLRMFLSVESGGHYRAPDFRCAPALAFRLEPLTHGPACVDGERVPCEPMQGELVPGMGLALMPQTADGNPTAVAGHAR